MTTSPSVAEPSAMHRLLHARSVAVIGASEDRSKFGGRLIHNLLHHGFQGTVYPINPKRDAILGHRAYPDIADVPSPPDVAAVPYRCNTCWHLCKGASTRASKWPS